MNKKHSKIKDYLEANVVEFSQPDSERLSALYSDFTKLVFLNKFAYDTNINFWRRVILDCNLQGYLGSPDYALVIDKDTSTEKFHRPILGKPLALEAVFDHMEKEQELVPIENFDQVFAAPTTWFGWIYDNVLRHTWEWRWRALTDSLPHPAKQYVVVPTLKAVAKAIMDHHLHIPSSRATDHVLTLTQFKARYGNCFVNQIQLTDADIHLILKYLHSQHGVAVADQVKGYSTTYTVIKFPSSPNQVATITAHDEALVNIRTTCYALSVQVDELQKKSEALAKESVAEKQKGHTAKALYCLKKRKNLQQVLERRLKSMETMDTILMKIESSHDDLQIVQAFNLGADTLKSLLGENGLNVDTVDEAMQQLQDVLQDQKEIEDAMKMGIDDMQVDESDIEQELAELVQEQPKQEQPKQEQPMNEQQIQSELSRLNQMFSSVKKAPTAVSQKRERELAS